MTSVPSQPAALPPRDTKAAEDQVILPLNIAVGICMRGIKTRIGRSMVTLLGVSFGIAFLMSVVAGVHVRESLSEVSSFKRDVERRIAATRAELGILKERSIMVVIGQATRADRGFSEALSRVHGANVTRITPRLDAEIESGDSVAASLRRVEAVVIVSGAGPFVAQNQQGFKGKTVILFGDPPKQALGMLEAVGVKPRVVTFELRDEEVARAKQREEQARQRMIWVVAVSLLITLIGITNAMLMSVTERFREIGTMKCLGALSTFVVKLFLIESSLLGFVGSVFGVLIGGAFSIAAYAATFGLGTVVSSVSFLVLIGWAVACVVVGVILSVIAGIYPARVAAKMRPAAALATNV